MVNRIPPYTASPEGSFVIRRSPGAQNFFLRPKRYKVS
jgi:hypothetical protein